MTSAWELFDELEQRGVRLAVDGDQLRYRAPRGALTEGLRQFLKAYRADFVAVCILEETFRRIARFWVVGTTLPPASLESAIERAFLTRDVRALRLACDTYERAARSNILRRTNENHHKPAKTLKVCI